MKPLILLTGGTGVAANGTPTYNVNCNYAENIRRVGGLPILAVDNCCAEEYADLADGLLLTGGKDVDPKLYGQDLKYDFVIMDEKRDEQEMALIKEFVKRKKPIFGICRGVQVLNVYFGGTLYQDIPDQLGGEHSKGVNHPLKLKRIPSSETCSASPSSSTATIIRLSTSSAKALRRRHGPTPTAMRSWKPLSMILFLYGPSSGTRSA